jgi:hypothetical protein
MVVLFKTQNGIYLPSAENILLQNVKQYYIANSITWYALHTFLSNLNNLKGIISEPIETTTLWDYIEENLDNFQDKDFTFQFILQVYKSVVIE